MLRSLRLFLPVSLGVGAFLIANIGFGCASATGTEEPEAGEPSVAPDTQEPETGEPETGEPEAGLEGLVPAFFLADALASPIVEVDCTLSDGTDSTCYQIEIRGEPADHDVGPFCPRNISDGPDVSGLWIESGVAYDADGSFIENLATFYDDDNWQLFDPDTGDIRVTETLEACEAAARPDVAEEYNNYCVECALEDLGGGVAEVHLIPKYPRPRATVAEVGVASSVGVALNGVQMDPPAPVDAILSAYTIAAFDDCGGHVNPFAGYHYHAATGCPERIPQDDGHGALIGYALDGYGIYEMLDSDGNESTGLDECRGHTDDVRGYHYQVASAGENMFIGCFHGVTAGEDAGGPGGDGPGGGEAQDCVNEGDTGCCGDAICDGPETADNCAVDCE